MPTTVSYDIACLFQAQTDLLKQILQQLQDIKVGATLGFAQMQLTPFTLTGDGTVQKILDVDPLERPRRVLIIAAARTDVGDAVLAISPVGNVSPNTGPVFPTGSSNDLGVVPGGTELYASQLPATGASPGNLNIWVWSSV